MKFSLLFLLVASSLSLFGQITLDEIVEASNNSNSNDFQEHLANNGFTPTKIEKSSESWGYNLESGKAHFWVHIRKTENDTIDNIQIISWGHEIHSLLVEAIVKKCKYQRAGRHYEGTYYLSYLCEDLFEIDLWDGDKDGIDYFIIDIYIADRHINKQEIKFY